MVLAAPAEASPSPRPIALLFHQGGFVDGAADMMAEQQATARGLGLRPVRVDYELGNLPAAVRDAKAAAAQYARRPALVAYGESAGGGLAALLAARGLVDAAVTYSGVNNLSKWFKGRDPLQATPAQLRKWSPTARRSKNPILTYTTAVDPYVAPEPTRRWARRDPKVRHREVLGLHIVDLPGLEGATARNVRAAMRWLARPRPSRRR
jgi:acetyl esterase/lipase